MSGLEQVTTVEQLDALPVGAVIRDATPIVYEKSDDHLTDLYGPWYSIGYEVPHPSTDVVLPAVVLSLGEERS